VVDDSTDVRGPGVRWLGPITAQRLAAGIYGLVIGAAVLAATGGDGSLAVTAAEVGSALVVYWLAETYAEVLGHHATGERLGRTSLVAAVRRGLAMIELSALPLLALVLARVAGLTLSAATTVALGVTAVLLIGVGLLAGWRLGLTPAARVGTALAAGIAGLLMITLKVTLH
jgi:hypothetical protein